MTIKYPLLSSITILSAITGDSISMSVVLAHYSHYINSFCIQNTYSADRKLTVQIDEFKRRQLETKLIDAILKFEVRN